MNYLLDTNHWSYIQRRHPRVLARLESLPNEATLYMPVIVQGELLSGVELAASESRKEELMALYEQAIAKATDILAVTPEVAAQYAVVFAGLRRKGRPVDTNDIWIAAIARVHDLVVVSTDGHFGYVEGLRVDDWTKPQPMQGTP